MERYYPFEHKDEKKRNDYPAKREERGGRFGQNDNAGSDEHVRMPGIGKGKRGGNSALSKVVHKVREGLKEGDTLELAVTETGDIGAFLTAHVQGKDGKEQEVKMLLPFSEQTRKVAAGDRVKVTLYEDKGGRITATMREPILKDGQTGVLKVSAMTKIGAFVNNGMPKEVLVPFRELQHTPEPGDELLVHMYKDKSGRTAATMRVYDHLDKNGTYKEGDMVKAFVYEINPEMGAFVAVDDHIYGMIPRQEIFEKLSYGDRVSARVQRVRNDGKLDLLIREKLYLSSGNDAEKILAKLSENGGTLPYADKADAAVIAEVFGMSKNQFKRALGGLYKKRLIEIDRETDTVKLIANPKGLGEK